MARIVRIRWVFVATYLAVSFAIIGLVGSRLGTEIFPTIDTGQFRLRIRAPDGTDIDRTEQVVLKGTDGKSQTVPAGEVMEISWVPVPDLMDKAGQAVLTTVPGDRLALKDLAFEGKALRADSVGSIGQSFPRAVPWAG